MANLGVPIPGGQMSSSSSITQQQERSYVPQQLNAPPFILPAHPLRIEAETWQRDSHDLFDYEAKQVQRCRYYVSRQVRLLRYGTNIAFVTDGQSPPVEDGETDYLLNVKVKDGRYLIGPADRTVPNTVVKKLWMIVKDLPAEQHVLQEGDMIKLGRFKLKVKQLARRIEGEPVPELKLDDTDTPLCDVSGEDAKTMQCRICLLEGGTPEDPLICPCVCKGSIKYVHVECLRHWINGRLNLTDEKRFFFKQLPCELCKQQFPSAIRLRDGERIPIVKVPNTEAPFIVLENIVGGNVNRGIHVFSMAGRDELKLGRGHESDVRIPDVSISRYHATIRFNGEGNKFTLDDHKSKFGTLVSLRRTHALDRGDKFSVQVGRTVLKLVVDDSVAPSVDIVAVAAELLDVKSEGGEEEGAHVAADDNFRSAAGADSNCGVQNNLNGVGFIGGSSLDRRQNNNNNNNNNDAVVTLAASPIGPTSVISTIPSVEGLSGDNSAGALLLRETSRTDAVGRVIAQMVADGHSRNLLRDGSSNETGFIPFEQQHHEAGENRTPPSSVHALVDD